MKRKNVAKPEPGSLPRSEVASAPTSRPEDASESSSAEPARSEPTATSQRLLARMNTRPPAPKFKVGSQGGHATIESDHPDTALNATLLLDTFATTDLRFADVLLGQVASAARTGKELKASELNGMLALIHTLEPRDPIEALLVTQAAAVHNAAMLAARRLNHTETIDQQDSASSMFNKLARTFCSQVEALKRYRSGGEQNVRVTHQHVNVTAGQAVIGIGQGGGGAHEKSSQSHALGAVERTGTPDARRPALLGHEQAQPLPLSSPGREGPACVPHARREGGSTKGEG